MAGKFVCPKCGSENIQRCSVIYQQGTVDHSYTSRSGDYSVDTSGTESTALAQSVAPPAKKDEPYGSCLGCIAIAVVLFWWGYVILVAVFGLAAAGWAFSIKEAMEYNGRASTSVGNTASFAISAEIIFTWIKR